MTFAIKPCATCFKSCYPTERVRVSDVWVHKHCLKCCECNTTLSLNSVYLAPSPMGRPPGSESAEPPTKLLYCAKDVPKIVHTSIVDSVALKTAMKAPNPTTVPVGVMESKSKTAGGGGVGGKGRTIRFKGLTLRSKSISAGLNAPRLDIPGQMRSKVIVGQVGNVGLDSWDISHAMSVQSQVSSPIRSHPAIHAQRTGSSAGQWPMPSQPLEVQQTGQKGDDILSASKGEAGLRVEADLVRNLIKVFQLDAIEQVEMITDPGPLAVNADVDTVGPVAGTMTTPGDVPHPQEAFKGTLKPSASALASVRSGIATPTTTIRTLRSIAAGPSAHGERKGTLTLARIKGNLRRPALSELFDHANTDTDTVTHGTADGDVGADEGQGHVPPAPQNTPAKGLARASDTFGRVGGTIRGTIAGRRDGDTIRGTKLLEAFLPLAAHLVPLPCDRDDDNELYDDWDEEDGDSDEDLTLAQKQLAEDLGYEGLELVMLFEEEPLAVCGV